MQTTVLNSIWGWGWGGGGGVHYYYLQQISSFGGFIHDWNLRYLLLVGYPTYSSGGHGYCLLSRYNF